MMKETQTSISSKITLWQEIRDNFSSLQPVWPFFALLTLAMAVIYGMTVVNDPIMRQPWMLVGFTLMMIVHTGLHWLSPVAATTHKRSNLYLAVQVALVLGIIALAHFEMLVYGLFIGLIGETLGLVRPLRRSIVVIVMLTAVMTAVEDFYFGLKNIASTMITILPLIFFVVIYVYLFTRQLEEKKRAEDLLEDLEIAHQQLTDYANRVEQLTLTNERQRMARELHDTLAQGLAGVILQLEAAQDYLGKGNEEKASAILQQSITRARSTLGEARQVIDDLRRIPDIKTDLRVLLEKETVRMQGLKEMNCTINCPESILLSEESADAIEKIVREGLTNILRHADADHCNVFVTTDAVHLILEIADNGKGFDPEDVPNTGHYGLVGMRERVQKLGGRLRIESTSDFGTHLTIELPIAIAEGMSE